MKVFKSYDIRGVFPTELDAALGRKIGVALGRFYCGLEQNRGKQTLRIVVGRDMRTSAPEMAAALIDGLNAAGLDVLDIGMVTTPCQYFAIQRLGADGGVMCTASHNPPQYIGFKVSRELAIPVSFDTGLNQVADMLDEPAPTGRRGTITTTSVDDDYVAFLAAMGRNLKPLRVAADASNGMAGKYLPALFDKLPCDLEGLYLKPDGTFPNHEADPLKPQNLEDVCKLVRATGSAVGFCYDGDADRVAIVDETGAPIGCDLITALLAGEALHEQPGSQVAYDLRSSKVVPQTIVEHGGTPVRSRVGHSHVKQTMRQMGILCGGELSGHYYFQLHDRVTFYADSALVATMRLLNVLSAADKPLSQLIAPLRRYHHTGEINFQIEDKEAALAAVRQSFADARIDELDGVTVEYPDWWLNVRPSNTEPLLRLTLEGDTPQRRDAGSARIFALLERFGRRATGGH